MSFPAEPVRIRDRVFPSQAAAAAAMGVTQSAVSKGLRKLGHADRVGLGLGGAQPGNQNPAKPLVLCGRRFASRKEAARVLGLGRNVIQRAIKPGASDAQRAIVLRAMMEKFG